MSEADQSDENLLQMSLQLNHIRNDPSSSTSPFHCNMCKVPFSGIAPLSQHLVSAKHKKKVAQRDAVAAVLSTSSEEDHHILRPSQETQATLIGQELLQISGDIKEALEKGDIVEDKESTTSPYQCKVCHIPVTGLAPLKEHVKSAKHVKKASERSISLGMSSSTDFPNEEPKFETSTPKNDYIRPVFPSSNMVQDALNKGHVIENLGSLTSPYQCKLCHVPLSGLAPLQEHIKSAKHLWKSKETYIQTDSQTTNIRNAISKEQDIYQPNMEQNLIHDTRDSISVPVCSNDLASQYGDTATSVINETDAVSKSFELGHVRSASGFSLGTYFCEICQVPLTGEAPLHQHINSPNHAKKLKNKGGAFDMSGLIIALPNTGIIEEVMVKKAIEDGHVCKDELSLVGAYFCKICQVPLTGVKPLEQHLLGSNHLVCARKNYQFTNLSAEIPKYTENEDSLKISEPVKLPIVTKTLETSSPPELPIWADYKVITCENPVEPDEHTYKNLSNPRGHVYIFNNIFQNDSNNFRPGANCDSINLKYIFERMGYRVYINNDLSRDETYTKLAEIQKEKELAKVDSFIMVILSHGEDSTKFYANDMELIHLDNIRYKFIDGKCPQLKGKPKIFMCNYCRGNIKQNQLQTDAPLNYPDREAPADMVTIHASIDGFQAIRHALKGTIFVQSLCETLSKHAHNMEFRWIYRILSNTMKEKLGTTAEMQEYVFKDFYLNPTSIE